MNTKGLKTYLLRLGCSFENHSPGSQHLTVTLRRRIAQLPTFNLGRELGTRFVNKIKKDLRLP